MIKKFSVQFNYVTAFYMSIVNFLKDIYKIKHAAVTRTVTQIRLN